MSNKLTKSLIGAAVAAMALTACSSDDSAITEAKAQNEITFNVATSRPSRALAYDSKDDISNFKVAAWFHGEGTSKGTYFNPEVMKLDNGKWAYDDGNVRYWPNNGEKLDFFTWVDYANVSTGNKGDSKGYTLTFDENGHATLSDGENDIKILDSNDAVDLLYAATFDQEHSKNATSANKQVTLAYKHAFAQVGVTAKVVNPNIHMVVKEVALVNILSGGKFKFPESASDDAEWTTTADDKSGVVAFSQTDDAVWTLSATETDLNTANNRFMVLPQEVNETNGNHQTPCIRLLCKVWNVTNGEAYVENDDLQIYGDADYKYLYIPVNFNWEMGKNYTYKLSFGTGNAGFDPAGNKALVLVDWDVNSLEAWTPQSPEVER